MVVTVTKIAEFGLYPGQQAVNMPRASMMLPNMPRGYEWYPDNLCTTPGDVGTCQTYNTWMSEMASRGVSLVMLRLSGRNRLDMSGAASLEPPPYGTYNIWHSALDPSNLAQYRADQVTHPVDPAVLASSNLDKLIKAAEMHGVKLWIELFEAGEIQGDWGRHAYNSGANYIDGSLCEIEDRGFIANVADFFTDANAIAAQKARIQFILDTWGDNPAIAVFEIMGEIFNAVTSHTFWGESEWNAAVIAHIRDEVIPWTSEIAMYLYDNDPYHRHIAHSQVYAPPGGAWSSDPDDFWNIAAELMDVYPIDIIGGRGYLEGDFNAERLELQLLQEKFGEDRIIAFSEYWPYTGAHPWDENSPFTKSKKQQWLLTIGSRYGISAMRWPGIEESAQWVWASGGYSDPDMHEIVGVTEVFNSYVDYDAWGIGGQVWDDSVSSPETTHVIAYGNPGGQHILMMLIWSSSGSKSVAVSGLAENGAYTLRVFNWIDGTLDSTQNLTATVGVLGFTVSIAFTENVMVAYLSKD